MEYVLIILFVIAFLLLLKCEKQQNEIENLKKYLDHWQGKFFVLNMENIKKGGIKKIYETQGHNIFVDSDGVLSAKNKGE